MAAVAKYLADTSVLTRVTKPTVLERLQPLFEKGIVGICSIVEMELIFGARDPSHCDRIRDWFRGFEHLPITDDVTERSVEVRAALVERSEHRTVKLPDLIIAAAAERHRVTVLHYDKDFDRIAKITGQPCEWVVPPGEAD
ncbi:PIN domain nuclease [Glycomyces salinus]|uniref:PIN domain nuclease n=1 Tax=Glycomyces salinus TaxID=980294 RepID=UPI0018EDC79F|nr:PIN domain nuclease [Glycomyces salinus]